MSDWFRYYWRVLRRGTLCLEGMAGWFSLVVLVLGVAGGIAVPQVFHVSHWLTAVMVLGAVLIAVLVGSYQVWAEETRHVDQAEQGRKDAEAALEESKVALAVEQAKPKVKQTGITVSGGSNNRVWDNVITNNQGLGLPNI